MHGARAGAWCSEREEGRTGGEGEGEAAMQHRGAGGLGYGGREGRGR